MKISAYTAHVLRDGIEEAKLDLVNHDEDFTHEPAKLAASSMIFGGLNFAAYSGLEERAYWHVIEHETGVTRQAHKTAGSPMKPAAA